MANKILKGQILEVIENQIRNDDPKCTKETLNRLIANKYSEKVAKEKIAAVLIEEMYYILKNNEPFNEERYATKLKKLK